MPEQRQRPRVLFAINSLAGGGAERVLATIVGNSQARQERYDIQFVLLDTEDDAYPPPPNVEPLRLDSRHGLLASIRNLRRFVGEWRPDVALSFLTRANVASIVAMRGIGKPVIISERVHTTAHLATGRLAFVSRLMVRLFYPRADRVVAISQGVADCLVEDYAVDRARTTVIYNPLDAERMRASAAEEPAIPVHPDDLVAMGRLVVNKNFALAIRAFAASGATGRLLVLGAGPMREELEAAAAETGVGDRVVLAGFQANPHAIVARCRGLLMSSTAEGLGNALVEAMALGVPVVSTDCPSGPAEVLLAGAPPAGGFVEGQGGLLVRMHDVTGMASAIDALSDAATHARLSRGGLARADDFSIERAVNAFWAVIEQELEKGARA